MNNKYLTHLFSIGYLLAGTLLFNACTAGFEDLNRPGNQISNEELDRDNFRMGAFFPQMTDNVFPVQENSYQHNEGFIGDSYARYTTLALEKFMASNHMFYNAPLNWRNAYPFDDVMTKIYGPWNEIRTMTNGEGINFAWAQVLRVAAMQRLTDMYGPIPYSQVVSGNLLTPYDSQQAVYEAMFKDLTDAINVLTPYANANPDARPLAKFDGVYNGDFYKWVKFANSLKLRMAIRVRFASPTLAQQMAEEAVGHPIGVFTSNDDNATYANVENPVWQTYVGWPDMKVCADITAYMNGYEDPRRAKYFQKATMDGAEDAGGYVGLRAGVTSYTDTKMAGYSVVKSEKTDRLLWMCAAEVAFLKAEGAMLKWNMGGTVKEFYEQGISLSFNQWGVSGASEYAENSTLVPGDYKDPNSTGSAPALSTVKIKWDDSATAEVMLERIITQKWIALWPIGQEAWSEYRRTGYPKLFPLAKSIIPDIPVANRIPFPPAEYSKNRENMTDAVSKIGGADDYASKMWWQKK